MAGLLKAGSMSGMINTALAFWSTLCEMAPYLLFGFLMAGALSVVISPELIERHLGGGGILSILKASLFGVPLPLCSCSVIPVATSLRKHGASEGATTAFLLSTPQTGVDSIMATLSLLGPIFAVFRPFAAFVTGILGGTLVGATAPSRADAVDIPKCTDECCSHGNGKSKLRRALRYGFVSLPRDIAGPLIIGLVIAGVISVLVPTDFFADKLGQGIVAMVVMMVLGIPVYVCATASIPVAAAMMLKGITPGAALVFLMTGPATNAAAIATLWKLLGKRTTVIYLIVVALTALAAGLSLDYLFNIAGTSAGQIESWMLPQWVKTPSAIVLLAVLGTAVFSHYRAVVSKVP